MIHQSFPDYTINEAYKTKVAYFCMEYAIDQALKIYSGGLGFLAGSHLRSAYALRQNFVAIGILWTYGYYDQARNKDRTLRTDFIEKNYSFLEDTGVLFHVNIHNAPVLVKAYYLPPHIFGTAPLFLLTTDIPENDYLSRTITRRLYDPNEATRVAQSVILGKGGGKLLDILELNIDVYHLNEGHAIPLAFYLYKKYESHKMLQSKLVFTTHTPEKAGNEERPVKLLYEMGFFNNLSWQEIKNLTGYYDNKLNYTLTALRTSGIANAVSKKHEEVTKRMWAEPGQICTITAITNAQNQKTWQDPVLKSCLDQDDDEGLINRKRTLKYELFKIVADQAGKLFDPDVLTIVWARRFADYKRPDLLLYDYQRFMALLSNTEKPVQVIWAGKPFPEDHANIELFNHLISLTRNIKQAAVLTGYELALSEALKKGSDVWLNTPRYPREASGTSGMTAAMNASVNCSVKDGWVPEYIKDEVNGFVIKHIDPNLREEEKDYAEAKNLMKVIEDKIVPAYYHDKPYWVSVMKKSMDDVTPAFDSDRMADEYYRKMYNH